MVRVRWKEFGIEGKIISIMYGTMVGSFYEVHFDNGLTRFIHVNELEILD